MPFQLLLSFDIEAIPQILHRPEAQPQGLEKLSGKAEPYRTESGKAATVFRSELEAGETPAVPVKSGLDFLMRASQIKKKGPVIYTDPSD